MIGKSFPKLLALTSFLLLGASPAPPQAAAAPPSGGERIPDVLLLGVGGDREPGLIRPPAPQEDLRAWVSSSDYPDSARREGRDAEVFMAVAVDAAGHATDCRVTLVQRAGGADFERQACAIVMSRGRFRHGIDAEGNARPGTVDMVMTFSLRDPGRPAYWPSPPPSPVPVNAPPRLRDPRGLALAGAPEVFPNRHPTALIDVDKDGRVTGCRILASAGTDAGDAAVCRHLTALRFEAARDLDRSRMAYPNHFVRLDIE
jgi:hypothetical protein